MSEHEAEKPFSTTDLLKVNGGRLDKLMSPGTDSFYDNVVFEEKEIAVSMEHFYGGPGSPQYGIISRSVDPEGIRHELFFSWFNGDRNTNFLPAGYFISAIAPDTGVKILDFDDSAHKNMETSTGSIDETNVTRLGELVDEYFEKLEELAAAAEEKKRIEKIERDRRGFARMLAETALSKRAYEQTHKRAVEEAATSGQGYAAELSEMDDESIADLIDGANSRRANYENDIRSSPSIIAEIRSFLAENSPSPETSPEENE